MLRTCDRLSTYRQICAQVAREHNLIACFMPKPFMGVSANGCHTNVSLWKGGRQRLNRLGNSPLNGSDEVYSYHVGGDNLFMPEGDDPQIPGRIGLQCVAGVMKHLDALTALGCPTVNSYRRLWDTGFWAPVYKDWGYQNRTTALRISAPGRFEYRAVDSAVNPYLLCAGLLKSFDDGICNKLDPGKPENRNIYDAMEAGKNVTKLPMSLGDSIEALRNDDVVREGLPGEMARVFFHYKDDEWAKFMSTVTEWDLETYIDCLP